MATVYLGLGSNLGDRMAILKRAVAALTALGAIEACSRVYETAPLHLTDQPAFLNMAVRLATQLAPNDLLGAVKALERDLGRVDGIRWGPRLIDIDILLYDGVVLSEERLVIPHPRLAERRFALAPLADVGAAAAHPVERRTVAEMLAALPMADDVRVVAEGV